MKIAFVVADPISQRPSFTTTHLAHAAHRRGHEVGYVGADDLTLAPDNQVTGVVRRLEAEPTDRRTLCDALAAARAQEEDLGSWDVVFLRFNPLREAGAQGAPAIDFGWRLRLGGVTVLNDPEGAQRAGGRMYLTGLPPEIRPRTLISSDPGQVKRFIKALDGPALIKPLSERNVAATRFIVHRGQWKNLNQMISAAGKSGYILVQAYLADAVLGEKRLLLLNGEPIRSGDRVAIYRRAPEESSEGMLRRPCDLGPAEQRIVDLLRPKLQADGLYFVGVDIVGDRVLELNVFTTGGAEACAELYGLDVGDTVIRDVERRHTVRRAYRKVT